MEDRKELMKRLRALRKKDDPESLFELFDVITCLQDESELFNFLVVHGPRLLKADPVRFIGKHVQYFLCSDRTEDALDTLRQYQEQPFINLTVEEFMKELEQEIRKNAFPKPKKEYALEDAERDIFSSSPDKVSRAVHFFSDSNIRSYLEVVRRLLASDLEYRYKILLQFILIEQGVTEEIAVTRPGRGTFTFIPSETVVPFARESYMECRKYLLSLNEAPSVLHTAAEILNFVVIRVFPDSILEEGLSPLAAGEVLVHMAKERLGEPTDLPSLIRDSNLSEEEISEWISKIGAIVNG